MYFQSIDDKNECIGIYSGAECKFENIDFSSLTKTWKPTQNLLEHDHIEYAFLYSEGKAISEMCPEYMRHEWDEVSKRMSAFLKSLSIAKVDLDKNCFFDLVPLKDISNFLEMKNRVTKYVFDNYKKPETYEHLLTVSKMVESIKHHTVRVDMRSIRADSYKEKVMRFMKSLNSTKMNVSYNIFGTKTGRLTVNKGFFPVLTLDKELRKYIVPENDLFVEIDMNGAEIRTLIALLGLDQPQLDIHEWNAKNVYNNISRDEAKKRFFAWLYNPASNDSVSSNTFDRDIIKNKFWNGKAVRTPFKREIDSDEYHCVNYTLQSTSNDVCLEQATKIYKLLSGMKSRIAFLMHDSIVLDFSADEKSKLSQIINTFSETRLGKYGINVSIGKNFGDLKELEWKQ